MTLERPAVRAEGLRKEYGGTLALDGLDLEIPSGGIFGLLGPNGAGKTTTIRVLATLLRPDAGRAEVAGFDVREQADRVRAAIGLTGQYSSVDELLTGRENLVMFSTAFLPAEAMPSWMAPIAEWNPLSAVISTLRDLFGNADVPSDSWPAEHAGLLAVAIPVALLAVCAPLTVRRFRALSR